jgi:hypothetical protein
MLNTAAPNVAKVNIVRVENERVSAIIRDPSSATLDEIRALAQHTIDGRQCISALEGALGSAANSLHTSSRSVGR